MHLDARFIAALSLIAVGIACPWQALGQDSSARPPSSGGGLLVSPTYVVFDGRLHSQSLLLSNRGVTTETYRVTVVNRRQQADGQLVPVEESLSGEGFAAPLVRYAPHEIVLPPNKPQTVRLLLQMPPDLPDGEYRSHILFQQVPTAVASDEPASSNANGLSVTIRAVFGVTIPLIVRKGQLTASASLSNLHLAHISDAEMGLAFRLNHAGTRSIRGDLDIFVDGARAGFLKNVAVFVSSPYRELTVPLTTHGDLKGHQISVKFAEDEEIPGAVTAAQSFAP